VDVQTTPRAQWLKIISRFPVEPSPEHRRSEVRHDVALGSVQVAYEKNGRPTLAGGKVLNVSAKGVLTRPTSSMDNGTVVLLRAHLGDESVVLVGRVSHCTETVGAFKLGVTLDFAKAGKAVR